MRQHDLDLDRVGGPCMVMLTVRRLPYDEQRKKTRICHSSRLTWIAQEQAQRPTEQTNQVER